jgi:hypothetical protein
MLAVVAEGTFLQAQPMLQTEQVVMVVAVMPHKLIKLLVVTVQLI